MVGYIYMIHKTSTPCCYQTAIQWSCNWHMAEYRQFMLSIKTNMQSRKGTWEAQRIVWNAEGNEKKKMIDLKRKQQQR